MHPRNELSINVLVIAVGVIYFALVIAWTIIDAMTFKDFIILSVAAAVFAGILGSAFNNNNNKPGSGNDDQQG